jgi:hypothetical protein
MLSPGVVGLSFIITSAPPTMIAMATIIRRIVELNIDISSYPDVPEN